MLTDVASSVLLVSSEVAPFAKTGGLADVAGSLPKALKLAGLDVRVVLPRYRGIGNLETVTDFPVEVGGRKETAILRQSFIKAHSNGEVTLIPCYFVDNYGYFDRPGYYGFPDDAERFSFFQKACIEMCEAIGFVPDILHANDWEAGFLPLLVKEKAVKSPAWRRTATVYTIHNLKYQGNFPPWVLDFIGVGKEHFHVEGVEFYGHVSFMKAGIVYADVVNTVSPTYAREIQTPELGEGLDGILRKRGKDLYGIVNGINYHEFNPETDQRIYKNYSWRDLESRRQNKYALQREVGLPVGDNPLLGMVTRLVEQKGLDIALEALNSLLAERDVQFVLLGTGWPYLEEAFTRVSAAHPAKCRVFIAFNGVLAQRIYAGSDIFLMPSRFEPCGLGQLIAMRYGSIPVVRKTGGLNDTVMNYDPASKSGSGFVFEEYEAGALKKAIERALEVYSRREEWNNLVTSAMQMDFSWNRSAAEYQEIYAEALGRKGRLERPA